MQNNSNIKETEEKEKEENISPIHPKEKCKIYRRYDKWKTAWIWYTRMGRRSEI